MYMRVLGFICIAFLAFLGCKNANEQPLLDYDEEIENLTTDALKKEYLEAIFKADQDVRDSEEEYRITSLYGRDSQEYKNFVQQISQTDLINLYKVETYLEYFGHPSKSKLGEIAALAPWVVVHHQSEYKPRITNFNHLYNGYKNGDIEEGPFSRYLARMYQHKNGEGLDMGGPYKEKDKIARLIEELDLKIEEK